MESKTSKISLKSRIIFIGIFAFLVLSVIFFIPARTLKYWEAWVYMGIIFSCAFYVATDSLRNNPEFLERRTRMKEKVKEQKIIIVLGWFLFLVIFLIPGFDRYYGWSDIHVWLVILSDIMVLSGYLIIVMVFRENRFASRIIEVNSGQKVISTGLYSIVRHPMYIGIILMYGFTPLALGSIWPLIGSGLLILLVIFRILSEEKYLADNLEGYKEYIIKTRYRLIPGIW